MSEENIQSESVQEQAAKAENKERDLLDGGFAVVNREKIIEEETREITPWYKHFINVFVAPRKMMEENFWQDPPKGVSIGIVGSILFSVILILLTFANPLMKQKTLDSYRMAGIAEEMLQQKYVMAQVTGVIGAIVGVFVGALLTAVVIQIVKAIAKDKAKFGVIFTFVLLEQMVAAAISCIDKLIAIFIPTTSTVLGLPVMLGEDIMTTNPILGTLAQVATIPSLVSIILLVIGYSVAARVSTKKSIIVIAIVEVFFILVSIAVVMITQSMMQGMPGAM